MEQMEKNRLFGGFPNKLALVRFFVKLRPVHPFPGWMFVMSTDAKSSLATRPSLLARLKDWSQQTAWREFDHDYAPLLRNVARKAGLTEAEADEVAQETLIAVAKKIGEFKHAGNRGSFRAWLFQQARWRTVDQFRARERARPHAQPLSHSMGERGRGPGEGEHEDQSPTSSTMSQESHAAAPETDPAFERLWDEEWENHVRQSALARVKRQVSGRQFQLFDLHVVQGMSVRDTAQAAGASMAAVYMAKSRLKRLFKREVKALKAQ
jgi:RNA polymerase sigma factor (sigma-70 family)